jgi:hypothetical protein
VNLPLVVVANHHRRPLVLPYLERAFVPHTVHWSVDYDLPKDFISDPIFNGINSHVLGQYRAWRGHQEALFAMLLQQDMKYVLVMEDDCVPNRDDWLEIVEKMVEWLSEYQVISFHGRDLRFMEWTSLLTGIGLYILEPIYPGRVWSLGMLCYLIRRDAIEDFVKRLYNGRPIDLAIPNFYKFALVDPSPFDHNRSQGSLIESDLSYVEA